MAQLLPTTDPEAADGRLADRGPDDLLAETDPRGRRRSLTMLALGLPASLALIPLESIAALSIRLALALIGLIGIAVGLRLHDHPSRRPWRLVFIGLCATLSGDVLVLIAVADGGPGTNVPADSALTAIAGVFFLAGALDASRAVRGRDLGGSLDALTVAVATAIVLWQVLVVPAAAPGWADTGLEYAGAAQVLALTAVGALMIRTTLVVAPGRRVAGVLLTLAVVVSLGSYLLGAVRESVDVASHYGGLRATTGAAPLLMMGAAALHPSSVALTTPARLPDDRLSPARMIGLALSLLAPVVVIAQAAVRDQPLAWTTLLVGWTVLVPTVLGRVAMLSRARSRAEMRATQTEERLASLLAHTGDVLLLVALDAQGGRSIRYASPSTATRLARDPVQLLGEDPLALAQAAQAADLAALLDATAPRPTTADVSLVTGEGATRWFDVVVDRGPELPDTAGSLVVTLRDITDRKQAELGWVEAALLDPLTGLPNRRGLDQHVLDAVGQAHPRSLPIAVLLCDLDGFKRVNDTAGHDAGDQLLVRVGQRLRAAVRDEDLVGRLGGDEFVVVCFGQSDQALLDEIGNRLLTTVAEPVRVDEREHRVGMSIGVASGRSPTDALHALLREADAALYRAKADGRGRLAWAPPSQRSTNGPDVDVDRQPGREVDG